MLHIASPLGPVVYFAFESDDLLKRLKSFIQVNPGSGGDIENLSGCLTCRGFRGEKVCRNYIVNVGEIVGCSSFSICVMNFASTPEYGELGSCRGPKILKYRKQTVSSP